MSALPELELSELELEMETTSPLDEAPDELLDESAAGALAAMQNSCRALSSPLSSHLMSWEREKKRKGLWGTICDDTARKGVQNPGGSAAADSSNSANTHTCKAKKVQIVIVIPSSLPPGSTPPPPTPTPVMSSLLYPPLAGGGGGGGTHWKGGGGTPCVTFRLVVGGGG